MSLTKGAFMHGNLSRLLGMFEMAKPQRKISGKVRERILSGKCLSCDSAATRRGLCNKHYARFYMGFIRQGSDRKALDYESKMIAAGLVLPVGSARKIKSKDPFSQVA
jgi:hypothetical protein